VPCYVYKHIDLIKILIFLLNAKYQIKMSEKKKYVVFSYNMPTLPSTPHPEHAK
jgi:hypothetical protein